jgi:hypothetical protein
MTIVQGAYDLLNQGGILCLIDLDHNCLSHHELPSSLARTLEDVMKNLAQLENFDPFAGRKLYAHLYDLKMLNIQVDMRPHNLIYGDLRESDRFNWEQKMLMAAQKSGFLFEKYYENGAEGFCHDFQRYFLDPRRFTYTPMILCRGEKP